MSLYEWVINLEAYSHEDKKDFERGIIYMREIVGAIVNQYSQKYIKPSELYPLGETIESDVDELSYDEIKNMFGRVKKKHGK